jgi:hypothetical protein
MSAVKAHSVRSASPDLTPHELFEQVIDGAVKGRFRIEVGAEMVANAIASAIDARLTEIGLAREFRDCVDTTHVVVFGLVFRKLVRSKGKWRLMRPGRVAVPPMRERSAGP